MIVEDFFNEIAYVIFGQETMASGTRPAYNSTNRDYQQQKSASVLPPQPNPQLLSLECFLLKDLDR